MYTRSKFDWKLITEKYFGKPISDNIFCFYIDVKIH